MHRAAGRLLFLFTFHFSLFTQLLNAQSPAQDSVGVRVRRLLRSSPLIDGHNDLPWRIRAEVTPPRDVGAYDLRQTTSGHTDLLRLAQGQVGAQFWSVYVPGEIKDSGFARVQLEQIDIARQVIARYPDRLALALSAADIEREFKRRRIGSLIGMEGGHVLENSLGALRMYYDLGARYLTLTHNATTDWADAALDTARHAGLTPFGREVVREMNRLGMLVDLSHVSPATMSAVLDVSEAPVIFSHSAARALVDHPRNVPDSILQRLAANGGMVMVTFVPAFAVWLTPRKRSGRLRTRRSVAARSRRGTRPTRSPGPPWRRSPTTSSTSGASPAWITSALAATSTASSASLWVWKTCLTSPIFSLSWPAAGGVTTICASWLGKTFFGFCIERKR